MKEMEKDPSTVTGKFFSWNDIHMRWYICNVDINCLLFLLQRLAWGTDDMEADARYKGNNLFYVSMYDHMYQVRQ